jgi:hypothetical protein
MCKFTASGKALRKLRVVSHICEHNGGLKPETSHIIETRNYEKSYYGKCVKGGLIKTVDKKVARHVQVIPAPLARDFAPLTPPAPPTI